MKIFFIGTVEFSKRFLEKLISLDQDIVGVLTKRGSNFNSDFSDLSAICRKNGISFMYADSANSPESLNFIRARSPEVIFCFGWSELIKDELLKTAPLGVIGYHPALLPQNRGRHPLVWALALGLKQTGSTFFFLDKSADSGDILSQEKIKIRQSDNARSLYDRVSKAALSQITEFIPRLEEGTYARIKQDNRKTNYWRKRSVLDGRIDWRMSASSIYNLVRALTKPYVGAHFIYKGKTIKVWQAQVSKSSGHDNLEPGRVVSLISGRQLLIKTGEGCIKIPRSSQIKSIRKGESL